MKNSPICQDYPSRWLIKFRTQYNTKAGPQTNNDVWRILWRQREREVVATCFSPRPCATLEWRWIRHSFCCQNNIYRYRYIYMYIYIYYAGNISFDVAPWLSVMTSRLPGSLKQTRGSGCLSWQPNASARFRLGRICGSRFISSLLLLLQPILYNLYIFPSDYCLQYIWY